MRRNTTALPHKRWGKILLIIGIAVMLLGLVLLAFASPAAALYTLLCSVVANAAGIYLLLFHKKNG